MVKISNSFKIIKNYAKTGDKNNLYYAYLHSKIRYGIEVYGQTTYHNEYAYKSSFSPTKICSYKLYISFIIKIYDAEINLFPLQNNLFKNHDGLLVAVVWCEACWSTCSSKCVCGHGLISNMHVQSNISICIDVSSGVVQCFTDRLLHKSYSITLYIHTYRAINVSQTIVRTYISTFSKFISILLWKFF